MTKKRVQIIRVLVEKETERRKGGGVTFWIPQRETKSSR